MQPFLTILEARSYRAATEDRAKVLEHSEGIVIVVADGVGGRADGAQAAEGVVASVTQQVPAVKCLHKASIWHQVLETADADLRKTGGGGETTAVVVAVTTAGLAGAAVGDSEVWIVPDSGDQPIPLAGRDRRKPYLGYGMAVPESFVFGALTGTLLVATDGLFKYANVERILKAARLGNLRTAAEAMAELPRSRDGLYHDDLALVLCRIHLCDYELSSGQSN
jgi:PPM family protein phosphatase